MIRFISEDGAMFGETSVLGIGKRRPKLIYGEKCKELREKKGMSVEELGKTLDIKEKTIKGFENQTKAMTENDIKKYADFFKIKREYFFDNDLEVYIVTDKGLVIKEYATPNECKESFKEFLNAYEEKGNIFVDFRNGDE